MAQTRQTIQNFYTQAQTKDFARNNLFRVLNINFGGGTDISFDEDDLIYAKVFKMFLKRNKAAPGLTGWAQVSGFRGSNPTNENMKKRMEYDIWYMNNWTIWLDFYIILKTFYIIFTKPIK